MYNYEKNLQEEGFEKDTEEYKIAVDMYLHERYAEGWFKRLNKFWFLFLSTEGDFYIISRENNTRIMIPFEDLKTISRLAKQIGVID